MERTLELERWNDIVVVVVVVGTMIFRIRVLYIIERWNGCWNDGTDAGTMA
jgi:hypothetical protein